MMLTHFTGSNLCKRGPRPDGYAVWFQGWIARRPVLLNPFLPLSNADGKAAYWVTAGLLVLIIFCGVLIWHLGSGVLERQSRSVIALSREQVSASHRYKIEKALTAPVQPVADKVTQDEGASGARKGPSAVSLERESDRVQMPQTAAPKERPMTPPPETIEQPAQALLKKEPISQREDSGPKTTEPRGTRSDDTVPAMAAPEKAESVSPQKDRPPSPPEKGKTGKRFFVQVDLANVRHEPSMRSKVMFQVQKGCSVTVTDKKERWYAIQMDDGRSGWVYQTLVADSLVPQKDIQLAVKEIKGIQVEPPVDEAVKVLFQLSTPHVPETLIMDEESPRVVCDFLATRISSDIGSRIEVNNGMIETIRIGLHERPQSKVRVVLDLVPGRHYEVKDVSGEREGSFVLEITAKRPL